MSRVVLLAAGYRPESEEQHKTTFEAAGEILGADLSDLIGKIQKHRIKRDACVYEPRDLIGTAEAAAIHPTAKAFWARVRAHLRAFDPQFRLFEEV